MTATHWHNLFRSPPNVGSEHGKQRFRSRLLDPVADLYGEIMRWRNHCYDRQWIKTNWLGVPVISVGNLTTGGTGKTPMVAFLAQMVREAGYRPGVILRGYGGKPDREADEVLLLRNDLPGVPIVADADRCLAGRQAIRQYADFLLADDAFQHRRLGRDLDICLINACSPFGGGKMLPAGRLREPVEGLNRADLIILTRCDQVERRQVDALRSSLRACATDIPILEATHQVRSYADLAGNVWPSIIRRLTGKSVVAFAAIASPEPFFKTVRNLDATLTATRVFRDHHHFSIRDLQQVRQLLERNGTELAVCTAKDMVKIDLQMAQEANIDPQRIVAVEIEIAMSEPDKQILREKIAQAAACVLDKQIRESVSMRGR